MPKALSSISTRGLCCRVDPAYQPDRRHAADCDVEQRQVARDARDVRMKYRIALTAVTAAVLLVAWTADHARAMGETAAAALKFVDGSDAGSIKLTQTPAGALLKIDLKGLTPGPHGLQVHEVGKCDGDFATAGPIYNPLDAKHGFLNDEGPMAGDLPNVHAAADGTVVAEILSPFLHVDENAR